jgi:hypothetical protein
MVAVVVVGEEGGGVKEKAADSQATATVSHHQFNAIQGVPSAALCCST